MKLKRPIRYFLLPLALLMVLLALLVPSQGALFAQGSAPALAGDLTLSQGVEDRWAGVISFPNGNPVTSVTVTINGQRTMTRADGTFELYVPRAGDERYVINAEKFGYLPVSQIHVGMAIETMNLTLKKPQRFDIDPSQPAEIEDERGTRISIGSNSLVDANGNPATGPLQLLVYTYDLTQEEMPGDMEALDDQGQPLALESAGVFYAQFSDAEGNEYNLAPDAQAEISIPVDGSAEWPEIIPLWSYDETRGIWVEEGAATQKDGRFVGQVSHFSSWNFDVEKRNPACIKLTVDPVYLALNSPIQVKAVLTSPHRVRNLILTQDTNVLYNLPTNTVVNFYIPPSSATPFASVNTGAPWGGVRRPPHPYNDCNGSLHIDGSELSISKSGPATAIAGEPIVYTLTVTNTGSTDATNLTISDTLPIGATYVSGGTLNGNVVSWTVPSLAAGSSTTVEFIVTGTDTITNSDYGVTTESGYSTIGHDVVTTLIEEHICYQLSVTDGIVPVSPPSSVKPSQNEGNDAILFEERRQYTLPTNIDVDISSPGTYATPLSPATLAAGTVVNSYFLHFDPAQRATTTGSVTFNTNILGVMVDDKALDDSDSLGVSGTLYPTNTNNRGLEFNTDEITVSPDRRTLSINFTASHPADQIRVITADCTPVLDITKTGPTTGTPGTPITYDLTMTNSGSITATNLIISDTVPTGATYVSGGSLSGNVVSWTVPALAPGDSITVQFVVTADETIINSDYGVVADDGYGATGDDAVITSIELMCICQIDLNNNSHNCQNVPAISFVNGPSNNQAVVKVNLDPNAYGYTQVQFDVTYDDEPQGWTVDIGDASTNNGWGGDAGLTSNAAETQILNTTLDLYSNVLPGYNSVTLDGHLHLARVENAVSKGDTISLKVKDEYLRWNSASVSGDFDSPYLYTLNGQSTLYGPVEYDIYAGFNRVIGSSSRNGSGASKVNIILCTKVDLDISKSGPATANPGDQITYDLTVTNTGSATASNLLITDTLPVGATYVSGGTLSGNVVSWVVPTLAPGSSATVQFVVTADQTIINNQYGVSADGGISATGDDEVMTIIETETCVEPPSNMTAWWSLDEIAGTTAAEIVNGNDGTHINGPTPASGKVAGALSFDGSNDYVEVPSAPELNFGEGDLSIDAWIKTTDTSGVKVIVDKRYEDGSSNTQGYSLYLGSGQLGFQLADGDGTWFCSSDPVASSCTNYGSNTFVADGEWHLVAVTVDRDQPDGGKFYVDGNLVKTFNPTIRAGSLDNDKPLRMASRSSYRTGLLEGTIDEVELFNRALDASEIMGIYNAGSAGKCKGQGTIGGIKFHDLNGNGVQDSGEFGLPGWTILLEHSSGKVISTVTDQDGNYSFTGLLPGTYTVSEQFQTGWTQTHPASANHIITLATDQVVENINFGNWQQSKEWCNVGWDINVFNTDSNTIEVGMRVNNQSGSDATYQVDVVGSPGMVVTDFTLTTPFDASQPSPTPPLSVANNSNVYVAIFMSPLPIFDGPSGQYQVIMTNEATGHSFGCSAQLWQSDVIGVRPQENVLVKDIPFGAAEEVRFELHNLADQDLVANIVIDEMFGVNDRELNIIRLNDQPPGQNVIDQIVIPQGQVVEVPVKVEFDQHVPEGVGDIILFVDVDNDGEIDSASSVLVGSVEPAGGVLSLSEVTPRYGLNDGPATMYIYGDGFSEPLSVTLGVSPTLGVDFVMLDEDPQRIRAVVPAGVTPGTYDITVQTSSGSVTLANAYEVLDSGITDDLLSLPELMWTNPLPMRVGYANSSVGLVVQHLGGTATLDSVTVEFRLDSATGSLLGRSLTNLLTPDATESSGPVTWEPTEPSTPDDNPKDYTVCAIIDPDNVVAETNEDNNVICQTITVLPPHFDLGGPGDPICPDPNNPACPNPDTEPPEVDRFVIDNDASSTNQQAVKLDVTATDYPLDNASGMNKIKYIEFEYIHGARRWVPIQGQNTWLDYEASQSNYDWQLLPSYGMRYMQAWPADNNRTFSLKPGVDVIDLLPSLQADTVGRNGIIFYRIYLKEGERFAATMTPERGDPDMYVWLPNGTLRHNVSSTAAETVEFEAPFEGTYQIEIHGPSSGSADYRLTFGTSRRAQMDDPAAHSRSNKMLPEKPAVPLDEWPEYYDVGIPPLGVINQGFTIYLPVSIR